MTRTLNFKSRQNYLNYLKYGYSHTKTGKLIKSGSKTENVFKATPGHSKVKIRGKLIKVKH